MKKLGISTVNGYPLSMDERLGMISAAGFGSVMMWWGAQESLSRTERVELAQKYGLEIENVHATTDNLNYLWQDEDEGDETARELEQEIIDCGSLGIHTIVMHLTNGITPPPISSVGIRRIDHIISCASKNNVTIAFENTRRAEHTRYVLDNYKADCVKFCYDCGHENYWTPDVDWMQLYSDRVAAVHLHDNKGSSDAHLIPFDGTINWEKIISSLNSSSYSGNITLEAEMNSSGMYTGISVEEFLKKCFIRGSKLNKLYNK